MERVEKAPICQHISDRGERGFPGLLVKIIVKSKFMPFRDGLLDSTVFPHVVHGIANFEVGERLLHTNVGFQIIDEIRQRLIGEY